MHTYAIEFIPHVFVYLADFSIKPHKVSILVMCGMRDIGFISCGSERLG